MPDELPGGGASTSTDPAFGSSSGTDVSLREYIVALRVADKEFLAERDRRLTEVATEREKALKIKEEADKAALALAREIQTYKDEKANELREQINSERGLYATKEDLTNLGKELAATIKPLTDYVSRDTGQHDYRGTLITIVGLVISALFLGLALYAAFHK